MLKSNKSFVASRVVEACFINQSFITRCCEICQPYSNALQKTRGWILILFLTMSSCDRASSGIIWHRSNKASCGKIRSKHFVTWTRSKHWSPLVEGMMERNANVSKMHCCWSKIGAIHKSWKRSRPRTPVVCLTQFLKGKKIGLPI